MKDLSWPASIPTTPKRLLQNEGKKSELTQAEALALNIFR